MSPVDLPRDVSATRLEPLFLTPPHPVDASIASFESEARPQPKPAPTMPVPHHALIAGITFDALGLPEQYFVSPKFKGILWVKLLGRVLSLQSLLMSSLQLGSFSYAKTNCDDYTTIVVAQDCCYIALLFDPAAIATVTTSALCQWMRQLDGLAVQRLWEMP